MAEALCDFCSEPHIAWRYPAHNFLAYVVAGIAGESVGDWAACMACHALIQAGKETELAERSLQTLIAKHPDMKDAEDAIRGEIAGFHAMFFAHRLGAALPVV